MKIFLISFLFMFLTQFIFSQSSEVHELGYKTKFDQTVTVYENGRAIPAYIAVDGKKIFSTPKDLSGNYPHLTDAGFFSGTGFQSYGKGDKEVLLRWIIKVWGMQTENLYYILDFTTKDPKVIGPFASNTKIVGDDDIKNIYWGKNYAKIVFNSRTLFYYEYKTKKVYSEDEW